MKKIVYFILFLIVLLLAISFATKNPQSVEVTYYFDFKWSGPLSVLLFCTLAIGTLLGALLTASWAWKAKRQGAAARREARRLQEENNHLRELPVRE